MRLLNRAPLVLAISVLLLAPSLTFAQQSSQDRAWQIIKANLNEKDAEKRVIAVRVLGLLPGDPQAASLAEQTAGDEKPAVRAAAATAMGQLRAKSSVDRLHALLEDHEPSVALAAASALIAYKDDAAYDVYYEVLTGERKAHASLTQQARTDLRDPKKRFSRTTRQKPRECFYPKTLILRSRWNRVFTRQNQMISAGSLNV